MMLHPALDATSELVMIDPPFMGIKITDDTSTNWIDQGLESGAYVSALYLDLLLFASDQSSVIRYRKPGNSNIYVLDKNVRPPRTMAVFAGRIFLGNLVIDGEREPLGIRWNGPDEFLTFRSDGSGQQLLLGNQELGDEIVAMRVMNVDLMAVLNKNSIWIGRRTGDLFQPAEFTPRVMGRGCISEPTARSTPLGVIYLSSNGVEVFDGNQSKHISTAIDAEILPIDEQYPEDYSAVFNPSNQRYYLLTPKATYIYEIDKDRWFKRSKTFGRAVIFPYQYSKAKWSTATGTWNEQTGKWGDIDREAENRVIFLKGNAIGYEEPGISSVFDEAVEATWSTNVKDYLDQVLSTKEVQLTYWGDGTLGIWLPDSKGRFKFNRTVTLDDVREPTVVRVGTKHTGRGLGVQIRYLNGCPTLSRIAVRALPRSTIKGVI